MARRLLPWKRAAMDIVTVASGITGMSVGIGGLTIAVTAVPDIGRQGTKLAGNGILEAGSGSE